VGNGGATRFTSSLRPYNYAKGDANDPASASQGVSGQCKTWTLDWTVDWTLDWTVDWTLASIMNSLF